MHGHKLRMNKGGARFQPNQKLSHQSCKTLGHTLY